MAAPAEAALPAHCAVCFDDEAPVFEVCSAGHAVCGECLPRLVADYAAGGAERATATAPRCPGGCAGGAEVERVAMALALSSGLGDAGAPGGGEEDEGGFVVVDGDAGTPPPPAAAAARAAMGALLGAMIARAAREGEVRGRVARVEERRRDVLAALSASQAVPVVRRIQALLVDRCPGCRIAFDGWDACNAVTCTSCQARFCGICRTISGDVYACVARCSQGVENRLFDRQAVARARRTRQVVAVRAELEAVDADVRAKVVDGIADILRDLNMDEAREASAGAGTPVSAVARGERMNGAMQRMIGEMRALKAHFVAGDGFFERLDRPHEQVSLVLPDEAGSRWEIRVTCVPYLGETAEEAERREEVLKSSVSGAFIGKIRVGGGYQIHAVKCEDWNVTVEPALGAGLEFDFDFIVGFSREQRAIDVLQREAARQELPEALQALLGGAENAEVLPPEAGIVAAAYAEQLRLRDVSLNAEQQQALSAANARLVQLVHGPPGTGKTTVITSLLQAPTCNGLWVRGACERHVVVVCSEKNLAVDAVAASLLKAGGSEPDSPLWLSTTAHGVEASLGPHAARFLIHRKVECAPAVVSAKLDRHTAQSEFEQCDKDLMAALKNAAASTGDIKYLEDTAAAKDKKGGAASLLTLREALRRNGDKWTPRRLASLTLALGSPLLRVSLCCASFDKAKGALRESLDAFEAAELRRDRLMSAFEAAKESTKKRLRAETRVVLVTLGSAHGVAKAIIAPEAEGGGSNVRGGGRGGGEGIGASATIIVDEASCVQTALFVSAVAGLSTLHVTNVVVIGDDRQLEPYWPMMERDGGPRPGALFEDARAAMVGAGGGVRLVDQYRMPRFLMRLLNSCFYADMPLVYAKQSIDDGPTQPEWVHVPAQPQPQRGGGRGGGGGRNRDGEQSVREAVEAAAVARAALEAPDTSVLVLTPYRQQRNLLRDMLDVKGHGERHGGKGVAREAELLPEDTGGLVVCTVDGAQGQEADVVILSLVRRFPSRFLNAKRLCVMLSRARTRLVVVGDHETHCTARCDALRRLATASRRVPASTL